MTPVYVHGRSLGVSQNGGFTKANTDPIPGGRLWPEAAASWNAMRAYIGKRHGVWIAPAGPNSSARSRAAQDYFWRHQPPPAARPYTSNHGWAIAVDVRTPAMAFYIRKYGPKFGWSHDEGARVGEWWHFRYVGGYKPRRRDPLRHLTRAERRKLRCAQKGRHRADRMECRRWLVRQRKAIWHQAETERHGWKKHHRRERYTILTKATK